jgi:hypothetical protein
MSEVASGMASGAATGMQVGGPWGAVAGGVIGAVSGLMGSNARKKAAEEQRRKLQEAIAVQRGVHDQGRADNQPYQQLGELGVNKLMAGLNDGSLTRQFTNDDFVKDPGYQFRLDEGLRGQESTAAARGGALGGAAIKALERYRQGYASNEFGKAADRFSSNQKQQYDMFSGASNQGANAVSRMNTMGMHYGDQVSGLLTGQGNSLAAGRVGASNALLSGAQQGYNNFMSNWPGQGGSQTRTITEPASTAGGNLGSRPGYDDYRWGG